MKTNLLAGLAAVLGLGVLAAQTPPPAGVTFEVASIKPAPPIEPMKIVAGTMHIGMSVDAACRWPTSFASLIRCSHTR